jgi:hypothetical protein
MNKRIALKCIERCYWALVKVNSVLGNTSIKNACILLSEVVTELEEEIASEQFVGTYRTNKR